MADLRRKFLCRTEQVHSQFPDTVTISDSCYDALGVVYNHQSQGNDEGLVATGIIREYDVLRLKFRRRELNVLVNDEMQGNLSVKSKCDWILNFTPSINVECLSRGRSLFNSSLCRIQFWVNIRFTDERNWLNIFIGRLLIP